MARVLQKELCELHEKLMRCFKETLPTKQFYASLTISTIGLGVMLVKETEIQNDEERRVLENEFDKGKRDIENRIKMLYEQTNRKLPESTELLRQLHLS
jgi:hypothetical protein